MQKYGNLSPPPSPSPVKGEEIFDFLRDHHSSILKKVEEIAEGKQLPERTEAIPVAHL